MKILILNQAFYPDVVATAQHATDLALDLCGRGHEVTVVAGRQAYGRSEG
ncbi:MAG: glycosyltransferase family 4 protein, partial [bacterium]|nr:glycosyltransferase family 4 protein [bacterium]